MSVFISLFTIALNAILAENFILVKFMGICPFMGVSKKQDTALGMGIAVTFVMGIASAATWAVNEFLLVPLNLVYMQTVVFILVIAALVQLVEMFLQKAVPALYQALGIYLPLITTNCAVLGVALLTIQVDGGEKGRSVVTHRLYLHTRTEGLLCAFFESIGQRKHGEALRPRWNEVNGSRGRCRVGIHEYTNKYGDKRQSNEITRFLPPEEPKAAQGQGWTQGSF